MAVRPILRQLRSSPGTRTHAAARRRDVRHLEAEAGIRLPDDHRQILAATNGVEGAGNWLRLFGVGAGATCDLGRWNSLELWKFAWTDEVHDLFLFGQEGSGDQVGYRLADLRKDTAEPEVVAISLHDPRPRPLDPSFAAYLNRFAVAAANPPSEAASAGLGPNEILVRAPSPLISTDADGAGADGTELMRMEAAIAMVVSGDVWTQVSQADPGRSVERVDSYVDQNGRARLRLIWA